MPESIAIDPTTNNLLVSASYGTTLCIFTSTGLPVTTYTAASVQMNQIGRIGGLAVDAAGNIFIADIQTNRVLVFDNSMNFQYRLGSSAPATGGGTGEFNHPCNIALDNNGSASSSIYVTDPGNNRVQKFTHSGAFVTQWGNFALIAPAPVYSYMGCISVDSSNKILITAQAPSRICEFDSNGSPVTTLYPPEYYVPWSVDPGYRGVAIDVLNNIFVACSRTSDPRPALRKMDNTGDFLGDTTLAGNLSGRLGAPAQVAIDGSGKIYLSDNDGSIEVYSP